MRVLIADDHEVVRKGVCVILKPRGNSLPGSDGFSAAERIRKTLPNVPTFVFSMHDGPELVQGSKPRRRKGSSQNPKTRMYLLNAVDAFARGENFFPDSDRLESVKRQA